MSRIKESEAYERHFQEVLREDDNSYELYLEELYLQGRKQRFPATDEQQEKPKTINPQKP